MADASATTPPAQPVGTMSTVSSKDVPDYRSWWAILAVFLGGALGTVTRESLDLLTPTPQLPYTTFAINIVGSFTLAVVYTVLVVRSTTPSIARAVRLFVGTGLLGGFTTYGSFTVAVAVAASRSSYFHAALYAAASIVVGVAAALLGRWVVERVHRRRSTTAGTAG
ncbi:fluoride efflux transporter FluC [Microbacterium sp. P05]|uniref:fluoride efflux transporter FluC n=1 Tax=Microbacterium sp. P05 TaxID=3366948 RepID=UPI00374503D9